MKLKILFSMVMLVTLLTGCQNTIHGLGQDMQKTGQEIQKASG